MSQRGKWGELRGQWQPRHRQGDPRHPPGSQRRGRQLRPRGCWRVPPGQWQIWKQSLLLARVQGGRNEHGAEVSVGRRLLGQACNEYSEDDLPVGPAAALSATTVLAAAAAGGAAGSVGKETELAAVGLGCFVELALECVMVLFCFAGSGLLDFFIVHNFRGWHATVDFVCWMIPGFPRSSSGWQGVCVAVEPHKFWKVGSVGSVGSAGSPWVAVSSYSCEVSLWRTYGCN